MDKERYNLLFDFYGELLTSYQKELLKLYLSEDLTFSEIADIHQKSRQTVYDTIDRSLKRLDEYEKKMKLFERFEEKRLIAKEIYRELSHSPEKVKPILKKLEELIY